MAEGNERAYLGRENALARIEQWESAIRGGAKEAAAGSEAVNKPRNKGDAHALWAHFPSESLAWILCSSGRKRAWAWELGFSCDSYYKCDTEAAYMPFTSAYTGQVVSGASKTRNNSKIESD